MILIRAIDTQREQDILDAIDTNDSTTLRTILLAPLWSDPDAAGDLQNFLDLGRAATDWPGIVKAVVSDPTTYVDDTVTWLLGLDEVLIPSRLTELIQPVAPLIYPIHYYQLGDPPSAIRDALGDGSAPVHHTAAEVSTISSALQGLAADAFPEPMLSELKDFFADADTNGWEVNVS